MKKVFHNEDVFTSAESVGLRDWGTEDLLYCCDGSFTFKLLKLNRGCAGGLQYHRKKDEVTYIISGELLVKYDLNDGSGLREKVLKGGDWIRFPTLMVHQEIAITDVVRVEVSTPYFNDRVRVEEEYGLGAPRGLPTTSNDEIIFK